MLNNKKSLRGKERVRAAAGAAAGTGGGGAAAARRRRVGDGRGI